MIHLIHALLIIIGLIFVKTDDTVEPMRGQLKSIFEECAMQFQLPEAITNQIQNGIMPENENAKCFFACSYKKTGMMDENGYLSRTRVNQLNTQIFSNDPHRRDMAMQLTEACEHVNQVPVNDGARGCERAALIFRCTVEKAAQFGLNY